MSNPKLSSKESFTEAEAAAALSITIARLHELLDQHIFTEGRKRPPSIEFTASDLLLLNYWNHDSKRSGSGEVIQMPKRS
jgi:hypothetical protein